MFYTGGKMAVRYLRLGLLRSRGPGKNLNVGDLSGRRPQELLAGPRGVKWKKGRQTPMRGPGSRVPLGTSGFKPIGGFWETGRCCVYWRRGGIYSPAPLLSCGRAAPPVFTGWAFRSASREAGTPSFRLKMPLGSVPGAGGGQLSPWAGTVGTEGFEWGR